MYLGPWWWCWSLVLPSMRMSDIDVWPHCQLCELCAWWGGKFCPAGPRDQKTSLSEAAPGGANILTPGPGGIRSLARSPGGSSSQSGPARLLLVRGDLQPVRAV